MSLKTIYFTTLFILFLGCSKEPSGSNTPTDSNTPPAVPFDPRPRDNAEYVSPYQVVFSWRSIDPDGDPIIYDFYFGNEEGGSLVARDLPNPIYQIDSLSFGTRFYWGVRAKDNRGGVSRRTFWSFWTR